MVPINVPTTDTPQVTLICKVSIYTIHIPIAKNTGKISIIESDMITLTVVRTENNVIDVYFVRSL